MKKSSGKKIAVVGSGLASISAIKVLVEEGFVPIVFDKGIELPEKIQDLVGEMAKCDWKDWNQGDIDKITTNQTIAEGGLPRKLLFGSDHFYGPSTPYNQIQGSGMTPPHSFAKGGLSQGWSAAVLPASDDDLVDWPIKNKELTNYYKHVLAELPYSANDDNLSLNFPILKKSKHLLKLHNGDLSILNNLRKAKLLSRDKLVFGQARLLVKAQSRDDENGCSYCGRCMSGCVYGHIYKASH